MFYIFIYFKNIYYFNFDVLTTKIFFFNDGSRRVSTMMLSLKWISLKV